MTCSVASCDRQARVRGLCQLHYARQWKYGDPLIVKRPQSYPRQHFAVGDTGFVQLSDGSYVMVDRADFSAVSQLKWQRTCDGRYAHGFVKDKGHVKLHRYLLDPPKRLHVDHINRQGLDCRRRNMRVVTNLQNCQNREASRNARSKYKGVFWYKQQKKWGAIIIHNYKRYFLGLHDLEIDAARAYAQAATKLGFIYIPKIPHENGS